MNRVKKEKIESGRLFLPLCFSFAAKIDNIPLPQFMRDPTKIANSLRSIQSYYGLPGVVCYCDPYIEAEALGCELDWNFFPPLIKSRPALDTELRKRVENVATLGRIPVVREVAKRLSAMIRDAILLVTLTGPITLASLLSGREILDPSHEFLAFAARAVRNLAQSYGEAGLDVILVVEKKVPELTDEEVQRLRSLYSPMWNTAKYYEMRPVLMIKEIDQMCLPRVADIVDCLITKHVRALSASKGVRIGFSIDVGSFAQVPEVIRATLGEHLPADELKSGRIFLVTTDDEIPQDFDREALIWGIKTIQNYIIESIEKG